MSWEALIAVSRILAESGDNPDPADPITLARLRKAVSIAYYAMFHALAQNNADRLVGDSETDRETSAWHRTYRALEHRAAYRQLNESRLGDFNDALKDFGNTFRTLQERRHAADYDPRSQFSRNETLRLIGEAEAAIVNLFTATVDERRELAAHVLFTART